VSFTLIHGGRQDKRPTGVAVLDGREVGLRLFRTPWAVQRLLIRHGQAWLCGPDSRGRARLRVAGLTSSWEARVLDKVPHGAPMALPSTPRRTGGLNSYLIGYPVAVVFLFAPAAVTYVGGLRHSQNLVSLIAGDALFVLALLRTRQAWRTRLVVESTLTSHVTRPAASAWACNAARISTHTPARCQRRNSPYTVCQQPYPGGTSRQGDPTRIRQRIPSINCRLVHFGGRPGFFPTGSSGCRIAHCASVRSARPVAATLATRSPVFSIGLVVDRSTGDLVYLINDTPI
jgi:hypothetical protein